ncbi:porin family protein [Vibrio lamellibrachiae]|uniref:outer membrane beta-barrel protein n=1 Tax=Vibrio lamellibrachiae TaxID=2910253 RepID=UPI003D09B4B9
MKKLTLIALSIGLTSGAVIADDDYSGHRVAIGAVSGDSYDNVYIYGPSGNEYIGDISSDDDGITLQYGYDFNRIFALNVGYSSVEGEGSNGDSVTATRKNESTSFSLEGEAGYAFIFEGGNSIKPYISLGYSSANTNSDYSLYVGEVLTDTMSESSDSSDVYAATGLRYITGFNMTLDARLSSQKVSAMQDGESFTFSVGYKF